MLAALPVPNSYEQLRLHVGWDDALVLSHFELVADLEGLHRKLLKQALIECLRHNSALLVLLRIFLARRQILARIVHAIGFSLQVIEHDVQYQ